MTFHKVDTAFIKSCYLLAHANRKKISLCSLRKRGRGTTGSSLMWISPSRAPSMGAWCCRYARDFFPAKLSLVVTYLAPVVVLFCRLWLWLVCHCSCGIFAACSCDLFATCSGYLLPSVVVSCVAPCSWLWLICRLNVVVT